MKVAAVEFYFFVFLVLAVDFCRLFLEFERCRIGLGLLGLLDLSVGLNDLLTRVLTLYLLTGQLGWLLFFLGRCFMFNFWTHDQGRIAADSILAVYY